jgi:hypothetical protein
MPPCISRAKSQVLQPERSSGLPRDYASDAEDDGVLESSEVSSLLSGNKERTFAPPVGCQRERSPKDSRPNRTRVGSLEPWGSSRLSLTIIV